MRSWSQAAAFLSTTAFAVLVSSSASVRVPQDIQNVHGTVGPRDFSIKFPVICRKCVHGADTDIEFEVKALESTTQCDASKVLLNGVPLVPQQWKDETNGTITVRARAADNPTSFQSRATWSLTCLQDEASLLVVRIQEVLDHAIPSDVAGFSASFRLSPYPWPLRVQDYPVTYVDTPEFHEFWAKADPTPIIDDEPLTVEGQFSKLQALKQQIALLLDDYTREESIAYGLITDEIKRCKGLKCYLTTAVKKAPEMIELAKSHLSYGHAGHQQLPFTGANNDNGGSVANDVSGDTSSITVTDASSPAVSTRAAVAETKAYTTQPLPPHVSNMPHFGSSGQHSRSWFVVLGVFLLIALLAVTCLVSIKVRIRSLLDPRHRRDCRARQEERRNRAAYRRAACAHRWKKFWSRFHRRSDSTADDYDEKEARLLRREQRYEGVVANEINQLQHTYQLVNEMVRAEEGRSNSHFGPDRRWRSPRSVVVIEQSRQNGAASMLVQPASQTPARQARPTPRRENSTGSSVTSLPPYEPSPFCFESTVQTETSTLFNVEHISRPERAFVQRRSSLSSSIGSLPPYQPPPSYETNIRGDITIIDGFQYTPSNTDYTPDTDSTPASSVVDCDSEMSFETGSASADDL